MNILRKCRTQLLIVIILFYSQSLYRFTLQSSIINIIESAITFLLIPMIALCSWAQLLYKKILLSKDACFPVLVLLITTILSIFTGESKSSVIVSFAKVYITFGVAYWIFFEFEREELIDTIFTCQIIILLAQLVYYVLYPQSFFSTYGEMRTYAGSFSHKNHLSAYMAFVIGLYYCDMRTRKRRYPVKRWIPMGVSIVFMLFSGGFTGVVSAVAVVVLCEYMLFTHKAWNVCVLGIGLNAVAMLLTQGGAALQSFMMEKFNRDLTFTGRTQIWEMVFKYVEKKPLTGYGYCSFWEQPAGKPYLLMKYGSAHNGWIDLLVQFGYPITILILLIYIILGAKVKKGIMRDGLASYSFEVVFLFTQMVYLISERSFQPLHYHTLFLFYCGISIYSRKCRKTS